MFRCIDCGKPLAREAVGGESAVCPECVARYFDQRDATIQVARIKQESRISFKKGPRRKAR